MEGHRSNSASSRTLYHACRPILGALFILVVCPVLLVAQGQADQITPEFQKVRRSHDPAHTPKIEAPDQVHVGEWFDVTVTIGADKLHPTLEAHYVNWIALFKNDVELARVYLHSVHTMPKVTFTIALEESAKIRVLEAPNHSAAWEASKRIKVIPAKTK